MPNTGGANPLAHDLKVHRQHCSPTAPNICWPFVTQNGDHSVHRVFVKSYWKNTTIHGPY